MPDSRPTCGKGAPCTGRGQLVGEPRPPESFPYGSPDLRRLGAGRYRIFYTIDEERRVVQFDHGAPAVALAC